MSNDRHVSYVCRLVHEITDLFDGEAKGDILLACGYKLVLHNWL